MGAGGEGTCLSFKGDIATDLCHPVGVTLAGAGRVQLLPSSPCGLHSRLEASPVGGCVGADARLWGDAALPPPCRAALLCHPAPGTAGNWAGFVYSQTW